MPATASAQPESERLRAKNATIKVRTTFCSSPIGLSPVGDVASAVENVSAACSDTTAAPHEYLDQTGLFAHFRLIRLIFLPRSGLFRADHRQLRLVGGKVSDGSSPGIMHLSSAFAPHACVNRQLRVHADINLRSVAGLGSCRNELIF